MENFNPSSSEFKKVGDLPKKHQENFTEDSGGGFIRKETTINDEKLKQQARESNQTRSFFDKLRVKNKVSVLGHGPGRSESKGGFFYRC